MLFFFFIIFFISRHSAVCYHRYTQAKVNISAYRQVGVPRSHVPQYDWIHWVHLLRPPAAPEHVHLRQVERQISQKLTAFEGVHKNCSKGNDWEWHQLSAANFLECSSQR